LFALSVAPPHFPVASFRAKKPAARVLDTN
jgi:hypothetical protein